MAEVGGSLATMRQLEERQVDPEVEILLWSPKMDILAVALQNGNVALFRLNWQRIWVYSPKDEETLVTSLSWRRDGKMLAVGANNGLIVILDIESNDPIHTIELDVPITSLTWIECPNRKLSARSSSVDWDFLTVLPVLSKAYSSSTFEGAEDMAECRIFDQDGPTSMLIGGTFNGWVHMYMNGFLPCAQIDMNQLGNRACSIRNVTVGANLSTISVLTSDQTTADGTLSLVVLSLPLIATCFHELQSMAEYFSIFKGTLNYLSSCLKQLTEAWEAIVLELDNKLANLAKKLPDGGMAADFLELLLFGTPYAEMEHFLLHEMTEKGVKKLDSSIEVSYMNIQKLVMRYLQCVVQSISFHLTQLLGHVRANEKYELFGLNAQEVMRSRCKVASLCVKGTELQQVINESRHNFHVFFRWLRKEILRISDEPIPEELNQMSQSDVKFIAEFVANFDLEGPEGSSDEENDDEAMEASSDSKFTHKHLERVGQYLENAPLAHPVDRSKCPWQNFLDKNPEMLKVDFVTQVNEEASLIQEFEHVEHSLLDLFKKMRIELTDQCQLLGEIALSPWTDKSLCQQFERSDRIVGCVGGTENGSKILYYEVTQTSQTRDKVRAIWMEPPPEMNLIDLKFYTEDTLSILLGSNLPGSDNQRLIQFPLSRTEADFKDLPLSPFQPLSLMQNPLLLSCKRIMDIADLSCHRELENINASAMAVSGPRKVAAMLFVNQKRIRIYDMEVEEEDDEEEDTMGTSGLSNELNSST